MLIHPIYDADLIRKVKAKFRGLKNRLDRDKKWQGKNLILRSWPEMLPKNF
jgi:hypothetical protein